MRKSTRQQEKTTSIDVVIRGRRTHKAAANSLQFLVHIEGEPEYDGRLRGANGMRWKVA